MRWVAVRWIASALLPALVAVGPAKAQYETVQGFADLAPVGPDKALGILIWNHGLHGQQDTSAAPPPPYVRNLHAAGWDVIRIKRNGLHESGGWTGAGQRHVARTVEEVERVKAQGYKRVILAGQSYGGAITLEAARKTDVYAIIPSAPGTGVSLQELGSALLSTQGTTQLYAALGDGRFERAVAILPFADEYATSAPERGKRSREVMAKRGVPYLPLDDLSTQLVTHGAAATQLMAFAYAACLVAFLDPNTPRAAGLAQCGEAGLPASPDKLAETAALKPAKMPAGEWWQWYEGVWVGAWSDPVLVSVALEKSATGYDLVYLYGKAKSVELGRTYRAPATLAGRVVMAELPHQTVTLEFNQATRQVVLAWKNKEGRSGSTRLRKVDSTPGS